MLRIWRDRGEDRGIAQVDVQVFELDRPVCGDLRFKTAANGPASGRRVTRCSDQVVPGMDIANRKAAGNINKRSADRGKDLTDIVADPPADRGKPVNSTAAGMRKGAVETAGAAAADIGPRIVGLDAKDPTI